MRRTLLLLPLVACAEVPDDAAPSADALDPADLFEPPDDVRPAAAVTCPDPDVLDVLGTHLDELSAAAGLTVTHPGPRETVGTLTLPGWQVVAAQYASLIAPCSGPSKFQRWCDGTACWQIECIDPGRSWIQHADLQGTPRQHGGWSYRIGATDVTWLDGTPGWRIELGASSTDPAGRTWNVRGRVTFDGVDRIVYLERVRGLLRGQDLWMGAVETNGGTTAIGELRVAGATVATLSSSAAGYAWTYAGSCP